MNDELHMASMGEPLEDGQPVMIGAADAVVQRLIAARDMLRDPRNNDAVRYARHAMAEAANALTACEPFLRFADEIVNAAPTSPAYREWLETSGDPMVVFSFAGVSITLGELRKAAALSGDA